MQDSRVHSDHSSPTAIGRNARTTNAGERLSLSLFLASLVGASACAAPKPEPYLPAPIEIPNDWWIPQGPSGQASSEMKLEEINGSNHLMIALKGGDDYAELFVDLGQRSLEGPKREQVAGAHVYDLAGWTLKAHVQADPDFTGDRSATNGIQFIVKDGDWKSLVQPWQVADGLGKGKVVSFTIPANESISRQVRGFGLKLTLNRKAAPYSGTIKVGMVSLTHPGN